VSVTACYRQYGLDVAHRRLAEEAFVFARELTCAFTANLKRGPCGVQALDKHPLTRSPQAKLFLILECAEQNPMLVPQRDFLIVRQRAAKRDCEALSLRKFRNGFSTALLVTSITLVLSESVV